MNNKNTKIELRSECIIQERLSSNGVLSVVAKFPSPQQAGLVN